MRTSACTPLVNNQGNAFESDPIETSSTALGTCPAVHDETSRSHSVQGKRFETNSTTLGTCPAVHDETFRSHSIQGKEFEISSTTLNLELEDATPKTCNWSNRSFDIDAKSI